MAATSSEADDIVRIVSRYLPLDKAAQLAVDLDKEVGEHTENESLRTTLRMFRSRLEDDAEDYPGRQSVHSIKGNAGLRTYADSR